MVKRKDFKTFGQVVCKALDRRGLRLFDLVLMIECHTGRFVNEAWLRKCFATKCPKWLVDAIRYVLDIEK